MFIDSHHGINICENRWDNEGDFDTCFGRYTYWTHLQPSNNRIVFMSSGSVNLFGGVAPPAAPVDPLVRDAFVGHDSSHWRDAWLHIWLSLPHVPGTYPSAPGQWLIRESAIPNITMNGLDKGGDNHDGGWQLYNFGMDQTPELQYSGGHDQVQHDVYSIWAHFGLRGEEFRLARVGFDLTVVGRTQ